MLTIKLITENTDAVIRGLEKKHFKGAKESIDKVLELNDKRRIAQNQLDKNLAEVNATSKSIGQLMKEGKKEEAEAASENLVIIEAAVFDTAPKNFFDELWYVYTTKENRIVRLMENRGYSREKCEDIIGRQASEKEYRALCSRVIDNNGDESDIKRQLKEILDHEIC